MGAWIADHALAIGYALTWAALAWYAWRLEARARGARRRLSGGGEPAGSGSGTTDPGDPDDAGAVDGGAPPREAGRPGSPRRDP